MADRKLVSNVYLESDPVSDTGTTGAWYGPSYPDNEVTADVAKRITNPAAWDGPAVEEGSGDFRFRADDFGEETPPNLREKAEQELAAREQADLDSRAAIFGGSAADVAESTRKARSEPRKAASKRSEG